MIAPEWVAVSSFGRRRSLSDLAVWGFPENFPENLPPQAILSLSSPLFLLLNPFLQFLLPSNAFLQLFRTGQKSLSYPQSPLFPSFLSLGPYRTPSEYLRNPSIGSPKRPFLGLFKVFPLPSKKG